MSPEPIKPVCGWVGSPLQDGFPTEGIRCCKTAHCRVVHLPYRRHCSPSLRYHLQTRSKHGAVHHDQPPPAQIFYRCLSQRNGEQMLRPWAVPRSPQRVLPSLSKVIHTSFAFQTKSFTEGGREGKALGRIPPSHNCFTAYITENPAPSLHAGRIGQIDPQTWIC